MNRNFFGLPEKLPQISVTPSAQKPFDVENREIRWWFARPVIGEVTTWCCYDMPDWVRADEITKIECIGTGKIHGIECYELKSEDFIKKNDIWVKHDEICFFVNQTDTFTRIIATMEHKIDNSKIFNSFFDENFIDNWGKEHPLKLSDEGKISKNVLGEYVTAYDGIMVCDRCNVKIGEKDYDCIRVIELTWFKDRNRSILMEGFITGEGRTILARRYNAPMWNISETGERKIPWDVKYPVSNRIVINGITFTHWYDSLSNNAF